MRAAGRLPSEDNHTNASKSEKDKSDRLTANWCTRIAPEFQSLSAIAAQTRASHG